MNTTSPELVTAIMDTDPPTPPRSSPSKTHLEEDIAIHIFSVSAAMVGVCITVISIVRVVIRAEGVNTIADDLLAVDALIFLLSCFLSYWALRTRKKNRMHRVERAADIVFLSGLSVMAIVCVLIVWAVI
ncbi:hypothetical protein DES53_104163 [Roseimicrobium gellanilyticum]|uniref:Uncharacterized protein n=1 Tax=Roseimicrobium gellanilyticum TaxID=748857 RepID=A0A366HQ81_9BACT|nr:hypothetical protein [Roseimicrobium gellanilyticum]RBP44344.1 hypothetical protein DES53_104163 [Roseimicrobium gellanilyticum]